MAYERTGRVTIVMYSDRVLILEVIVVTVRNSPRARQLRKLQVLCLCPRAAFASNNATGQRHVVYVTQEQLS